jgi:hypothetical protein
MNQISLGKDINILQMGNDFQISGLVFSGQGQSFLVSLPHKHDDINEPISQLKLDQQGVLDLLKQLDTLEVEIFAQDESGVVKQIVRKTQRQIDNMMQWQVFERDNFTCRYCGRHGIPMSVDHVIVWEEGGPTIPDNLLTACKPCNRDRASMPFDQWLNSPMYAQKSKNLTSQQKNANMMVVLDLPRLQQLKVLHVRSR